MRARAAKETEKEFGKAALEALEAGLGPDDFESFMKALDLTDSLENA